MGVERGGGRNALLHYVAYFMMMAKLSGLDGEVTRRVGRGAPCLSDSPLYLLSQAASNQLYPCVGGGQAGPPFPAFLSTYVSPGRVLSLYRGSGPRVESRGSGEKLVGG